MALSPAEKQARYRERKREEAQAAVDERRVESELRGELGLEDPVLDALVAAAELLAEPRRTRELPVSEDAYVKLMLSEPHILDRRRAERYARWRYRGVLAGRVASL